MHYLSLCLIIKDENPYLLEWLAYYRLVGVEHFYIYDNDSARPVADFLANLPPELVSIQTICGPEQQIPAYNQALEKLKDQTRWLGFVDMDEFVVPLQGRDLRAVLAEFEDYAGLAIPWTMYGSSGHRHRPAGLVMENYLHRYPGSLPGWHNIIKCFVNPAQIVEVIDPHRFLPEPGKFLVTEDHVPVPPGATRAIRSCRKIRLNHYFFRSEEEYREKLQRGRADRADAQSRYNFELFERQCQAATLLDPVMLPFVPGVRESLAGLAGPVPASGRDLALHEASDLADQLASEGRLTQAEAALCRTRTTDTVSPDFWLLRSVLARANGAAERAGLFARKALAIKESPDIYWALFEADRLAGQGQRAAAVLDCLETHVNIKLQGQDRADWLEKIRQAAGTPEK